jgi:hypothetical protein
MREIGCFVLLSTLWVAGCGSASSVADQGTSAPSGGVDAGDAGVEEDADAAADAALPDPNWDASTVDGSTGPTIPVPDPDLPPPATCGDMNVDPGEGCDDGNNDNRFDGCLPGCVRVEPLDPEPLAWTYYSVEGTTCLDGKPAGFALSKSPGSDKVMIYLEGGGACFDDACDATAFSVPFFPPPDGIFDRFQEKNPIREWNMIYVPYCTGDVHGGDTEAMLGGQKRYFHGYSNIGRYLEQWVATFPAAKEVLLTGISAGGFGAGLNAAQVQRAFASTPITLVDDSGPPFSSAVIPPCLQSKWRQVWAMDKTILAECGAACPDPDDYVADLSAHVLKTFPQNRGGVFSNTRDSIIRTFFGFGWGNGQWNNCSGIPTQVPGKVYEDELLVLRQKLIDAGGPFGTYYIGPTQLADGAGLGHTVLRTPVFYTVEVGGVTVPEWLTGILAGKAQHIGP